MSNGELSIIKALAVYDFIGQLSCLTGPRRKDFPMIYHEGLHCRANETYYVEKQVVDMDTKETVINSRNQCVLCWEDN